MHTPPFPTDIPPPRNEQDFEELCAAIYREVYQCKRAQPFGRRGQDQSGIDILLQPGKGQLIGVQAKKYAKKLSRRVIEKDIESADASALRLTEFLVATTVRSDRGLLEWIVNLSLLREEAGLFPVGIEFWDDISQHIRHYPALSRFNVRPPAGSDEGDEKRASDVKVVRELFSCVNVNVLTEHLDNFPYFYRADVAAMYDRFMEAYLHPRVFFHERRLGKLFSDFASAWERAMPQDGKYFFEDTSIRGVERFQSTGAQYRMKTFKKAPAEFRELQQAVGVLSVATRKLLHHVHSRFPELDLEALGRPQGQELDSMMRELRGK